jgi:monoamine oxidase
MARSSLFRALRRISRAGKPTPPNTGWRRREFLRTFGVAAAALPVLGCGDDVSREGPTIAIIGGGIAGLTASHFLSLAGLRADVYEASMRTGGRMFTQPGLPGGQLIELGGELVDSNHIVVPALCTSLGLALDDLVEDTEGLQQDIFHFNNTRLTDQTIVNQFTPVAAKMQMNLLASEGEDAASVAEFERIDAMSIPEWLATEAGLAQNSIIKELLEVAYLEEYGLEVAEQSAWNMLFLIDSETPDPFRVFGESDERFHIHAGSGALTDALATRLEDRVNLDHRLVSVVAGERLQLTFETTAGTVEVEADHVIYALPFTKLREVDLSASGLSAEKLEVINEIGYGTNAKLMMQFTDRHWEGAPINSGGGVITDVGQLQTIWATSRGQPGTQGILTNFVGGARGIAIGEGTAESQVAGILTDIEKVFPGITPKYVAGSAVRQHWPSFEFSKGSYACYKVGQWRFFGTEGVAEETQHFCGEHCSEDFQGYMEGGADTGALVAAEILDDLRIPLPSQLTSILIQTAEKRTRASYHGSYDRRMKLSQIRRRNI